MFLVRLMIFVVFSSVISGCAGMYRYAGKGEIELNASQKQALKYYLEWIDEGQETNYDEKEFDYAFAISPSTGGFASMEYISSDLRGMTNILSQEGAIERCNRKFKTKDCRVYAFNKNIIWNKDKRKKSLKSRK